MDRYRGSFEIAYDDLEACVAIQTVQSAGLSPLPNVENDPGAGIPMDGNAGKLLRCVQDLTCDCGDHVASLPH